MTDRARAGDGSSEGLASARSESSELAEGHLTPPEHVIVLYCLNCGKGRAFDSRSKHPVVTGVLNFFCDGECEDRYAARL